ncbi:MAG: GNAT family N-acetyltransferase [Planctomycetota bacterium]
MAIRRLERDEAPRFRALRLEARTNDPDAFAGTLAQEAAKPIEWFCDRLAHDPVFGAFEPTGELVGMAGYSPGQSPRGGPGGRVWSVYVRPALRRQRIGEALMRAVIEHARALGPLLHLSVVTDNVAARRLYERLGFQLVRIGTAEIVRFDGQVFDEAHYELQFESSG